MEGCAGELALADEARHLRIAKLSRVRAPVPTRDQHDQWAVIARGEPPGDIEAVHPGELHIEENDIGMKLCDGLECRLAVLGEANDVEPLELEQGPGRGTKVLMVINDQQRLPHNPRIVAQSRAIRTVASNSAGGLGLSGRTHLTPVSARQPHPQLLESRQHLLREVRELARVVDEAQRHPAEARVPEALDLGGDVVR